MSRLLTQRKGASAWIDSAIQNHHLMWFCLSTDPTRAIKLAKWAEWYFVHRTQYLVDKHPLGHVVLPLLRERYAEEWRGPASLDDFDLPLVFVKQKCVGTYETMLRLEKERRLKDLFQFGFTWPELNKRARPSPYEDEQAFRGIWRSVPPTTPVMPPPKFTMLDGDIYHNKNPT